MTSDETPISEEQYIQGLIELHGGLDRQGPGDSAFSKQMLSLIKEALPASPRIADIGCGSGIGALMLAEAFQTQVKAVDFSRDFLDQMMVSAKERGLASLIDPIECDMGALDWSKGSIDLLWSEGAAYNLTFEGALKAWRPFLSDGGMAVISELSYFSEPMPADVKEYWENAYPAIATEEVNKARALSSGFEVIGVHRLPSKAWWDNYYNPLINKKNEYKGQGNRAMDAVIRDTEKEIAFFKAHSDHYGYSFYLLKAV